MSNRLFSRFVAAKPEGRKTALGNFIFFPFSKFGLKIILSTNICTHGANNTYLYSFSEIERCCKQPCNNYEHNPASSLSSQDTFWTSSYWGWYFAYLPAVSIFLLSQVVIVAYYNIRLVLTLTISLLTAKTVLMTLFILRFDTMTGIQCHVSSIHNLGIHVYPSFMQLYQIF